MSIAYFMGCYKPLHAQKIQIVDPLTGTVRKKLRFYCQDDNTWTLKDLQALPDYVCVPCGQCMGCRIARSKDWAMRCMHELQSHSESCFVTLTYDDEHLPYRGTLVKAHFQNFMKRLRSTLGDKRIKYYMCGEYGETTQRPHYHAIIFGHDFSDKTLYKSVRGNKLYTSEALSKLWTSGFAVIGSVTYQSVAYVARYILKKALGKDSRECYRRVGTEGAQYSVLPEYTQMSLRPAIGRTWAHKYIDDCLPSGYLIHNGMRVRVPKYYMEQFELLVPERYMCYIEAQRLRMFVVTRTPKYHADNTILRLSQRYGYFLYKIKKLVRQL